jgi:hypothetical protein
MFISKTDLWRIFLRIAYLLLIAPLSVVRFLGFRGHTVSFRVTMGAGLVFAFSGLVDVMLFFWARPAFGVSPVELRDTDSPTPTGAQTPVAADLEITSLRHGRTLPSGPRSVST